MARSLPYVCLAAAALLTPAHARTIVAEPVAPPISLTSSEGVGLRITALQARGAVEDPLAFTELHLTFHNPEPRQIEGQFEITLPPGAAVSRFAMRQQWGWQEGEVVELQAARQAYEDFLHRRQDPALLEKQAGNQFHARVFPIPPSGDKEIIISYSQELPNWEDPYRVFLRGLPKLDQLDIRVFLGKRQAQQASTTLGGISMTHEVVEVHKRDFQPDVDFAVPLPRADGGQRLGLRHENLAVARIMPVTDAVPDKIENLLVLFDTSASRALGFKAQVARLGELLDEIQSSAGAQLPLKVVSFDQEVVESYNGTISGFGANQLGAIVERRALGASDLGRALKWVAQQKDRRWSRILVVSDGIATAGATEGAELRKLVSALGNSGVKRLDALVTGGLRDESTLKKLVTGALTHDGVVLDDGQPASQIAHRLAQATFSGIKITAPGASWVWPTELNGVQPGDQVLVYADLPPQQPLEIVLEGARAGRHPVKLARVERPLLERAWVAARMQRLEHQRETLGASDPDLGEALKKQIIELSTRFRVLCDYTGLLVLETEQDYERFHIERRALSDILIVGPDGVDVENRRIQTVPIVQPPIPVEKPAEPAWREPPAPPPPAHEHARGHKSKKADDDEAKESRSNGGGGDEGVAGKRSGGHHGGRRGEVEGGVVGGVVGGVLGGTVADPTPSSGAATTAPPPAQPRPDVSDQAGRDGRLRVTSEPPGYELRNEEIATGRHTVTVAPNTTPNPNGPPVHVHANAEHVMEAPPADAPAPPPPPPPAMPVARPPATQRPPSGEATAEPDQDHDGIPDSIDRCPTEPETFNGYQDEDGCPDRGRVVVTQSSITILDKVYFASGSSIIQPASYPMLDAVADTLRANPQIRRVEIQGHADGRERGADGIATARATAVRTYLALHGLDPARVVVRGYGKTRPLCGEQNENCWAKNRRVDFYILVRDENVAQPTQPRPSLPNVNQPPPQNLPPEIAPYEGRFAELMQLLGQHKNREALERAQAWRDQDAGDVLALIALGESYEALGKRAQAARAYGSVIDLFPSRADMRRFAGERLERTGELDLAIDTFKQAKAQRPDHPASHRLLAYGLLRAGQPQAAFDAIVDGAGRNYPAGRFAGVDRILREDIGLIAAAWIKKEPGRRAQLEDRLSRMNIEIPKGRSLRFVLNWETDANDVDFHILDAQGGHAYYSQRTLPTGGVLYADVTTGYGPECFTIEGAPTAYPYHLRAHYYAKGPMGYGMGKLEIIEHDGHGNLAFEERPFVIMTNGAFVNLGEIARPLLK